MGYPASICISVNEEVIHGIPGNRTLNEGDIISLDLGVDLKGYITDSAITLPVGNISEQDRKTYESNRRMPLSCNRAG